MTVSPARDAGEQLVLEADGPLDLGLTLAPLAHGRFDPTLRMGGGEVWLAMTTPDGPATLRLGGGGPSGRVVARAWGPGAAAALARTRRLVGVDDDSGALVAHHAPIRELQRRLVGLRMPASGRVLDALVPAICEQKVTGTEARRAYQALVRRHGTSAPGPIDLRLPPSAELLAGLPYHAYHPFGIERRRADVIRRAAASASRLERAPDADAARREMLAIPGIGPWTAAEVLRVSHGDPDALSVGDYHLPNAVAWLLAGEPRADDARMLELLAPYAGQRGRVQRLVEAGRVVAPRRGPRLAPRSIARI